jgi:hypothetical protein
MAFASDLVAETAGAVAVATAGVAGVAGAVVAIFFEHEPITKLMANKQREILFIYIFLDCVFLT